MYSSMLFLIFLIMCTFMIKICFADCDNLQDTCPAAPPGKQTIFINGLPCKNPATINAADFKTTKLTKPGDTDNFVRSAMGIIGASEFAGLNTLGLSIARTDLDTDGLVLPHSHPRASEMFFVVKGRVLAGFIDTQNNVFQDVLNEGDVIVFPRGLLHFCFNMDSDAATAFSVLNSQNPGLASITANKFVPDHDVDTMGMLVKSLISLSKRHMLEKQCCNQNVTLPKFFSLLQG